MATVRILNGPQVAAQLSAAIKDIARLTGFSERQVTLAGVGSILKQCAGRTKTANPSQIDIRTRVSVLRRLGFTKMGGAGDITINAGRRGMAGLAWVKTDAGKYKLAGVQAFSGDSFKPSNRHWKEKTWIDILEAQSESRRQLMNAMPMARKSAGLARQSWIQIADSLGIRLEDVPGGGTSPSALAKARNAIGSNGRYYVNGTAAEQEQAGKSYFVTLINRLPYHAKAGLDLVLAGVLAGRVGLYKRTFANGAFKSITAAAHNYPWMKTFLNPT